MLGLIARRRRAEPAARASQSKCPFHPGTERFERAAQPKSKLGQFVLDMRRHRLEIYPPDKPVTGHFLQLLGQDLLADLPGHAAKLAKAAALAMKMIK